MRYLGHLPAARHTRVRVADRMPGAIPRTAKALDPLTWTRTPHARREAPPRSAGSPWRPITWGKTAGELRRIKLGRAPSLAPHQMRWRWQPKRRYQRSARRDAAE